MPPNTGVRPLTLPEQLHRHGFVHHVHPDWHGHCRHNPGLRLGVRWWVLLWPFTKPCNRVHWHWPYRHRHTESGR